MSSNLILNISYIVFLLVVIMMSLRISEVDIVRFTSYNDDVKDCTLILMD